MYYSRTGVHLTLTLSDRANSLEHDSRPLVPCCRASIIIRSSASACLLAVSLFISVMPPPFCHRCLPTPCCTAATSFPQSLPTFGPRQMYICAVREVPRRSLCLSGVIYQDELSLCLSVFVSVCVKWARRPKPPHGWHFKSDWARARELWQEL